MYNQKQNRVFSQESPITLSKEIRTKDTDIAFKGSIFFKSYHLGDIKTGNIIKVLTVFFKNSYVFRKRANVNPIITSINTTTNDHNSVNLTLVQNLLSSNKSKKFLNPIHLDTSGLYNNSNLNDIIIDIITGTIDTTKINSNVGVRVI